MKEFVLGITIGVALTAVCAEVILATGRTIGQVSSVIQELYGDKFAPRTFINPNNN